MKILLPKRGKVFYFQDDAKDNQSAVEMCRTNARHLSYKPHRSIFGIETSKGMDFLKMVRKGL